MSSSFDGAARVGRNRGVAAKVFHSKTTNDGGTKPGKGDPSKPDGRGLSCSISSDSSKKSSSPNSQTLSPPLPPHAPVITYHRVASDHDNYFAVVGGEGVTLVDNGLPLGETHGKAMLVDKHGLGWYTLSDGLGTKMVTLEAAVSFVNVPAYSTINPLSGLEVSFVATTYVVDVCLWKKLSSMYRNTQMTVQLAKGLHSLAANCSSPPDLCDSTASAYIALCSRADSKIGHHSLDNRLGRLNSSYRVLDPHIPYHEQFNNEVFQDVGPVLTKLYTSATRFDYNITRDYRNDFKVVKELRDGAVVPPDKQRVGTDEHPKFIPLNGCEKDFSVQHHHTCLFRFSNDSVRIWDTGSGNHNQAAVSRTFCRVDREDELSENSYAIAWRMNNILVSEMRLDSSFASPSDRRRILDRCNGGRFTATGTKKPDQIVDPKTYDSNRVPGACDTSSFVAAKLLEWVRLCSRSVMTQVFDKITNVTRGAVIGTKLWFLEQVADVNAHLNLQVLREKEVRAEHLKRLRRMRAYAGVLVHEPTVPLVRRCELFVKSSEHAKPDGNGGHKPARVVGSFSDYAAIISTTAPAAVKAGSSHKPFRWTCPGGVTCVNYLITENDVVSKRQFFEAVETCRFTPGTMVFFNSSDDMCCAFNLGGRYVCFNGDISKNDRMCDSMSFFAVWLQECYFSREAADAHFDLAMLPVRMTNRDRTHSVTYQFSHPTEQSGLPTTTLLNNVSSQAIIFAYSHLMSVSDRPWESYQQLFVSAGALVGHHVTSDGREDFLGLQVLKHSPFTTAEGVHPYLNLGTIFRGLGLVESDLDHIKCGMAPLDFAVLEPHDKAMRFVGGVIRGLKNQPSNPIIRALRKRFCPDDSSFEVVRDPHLVGDQRDSVDLSHLDNTDAIMHRYQLEEEEVDGLVKAIHAIRVGQVWNLPAVRKLLNVDYGYPA